MIPREPTGTPRAPQPGEPNRGLPVEWSFTKGDARSLHIACASIVAKVARDRLMIDLGARFPGFGFATHKGYGTAAHRAAIAHLGSSPLHRRSFHVK
jgi:ribonuclease HII